MKFLSGKAPGKFIQGFLAAMTLTGVATVAHQAALAQTLLQQDGTLAPMEDAYPFDGAAGQVMTIELQSEEFDTILMLKGPDGEVLTSNDDFGGTLNSTIVIELPEDGTYSAIASSFSGQGGSYQIEVRPSSEYEQVFSRAYDLSVSEDFADSIEAYSAAIQINDADPAAYLGRAESRINQAYLNATADITGPSDLPDDIIASVVEDYLKAADLLEQQGEIGPAASLREQAQYFSNDPTTNVTPDPPSGATPPEVVEPDEAELEDVSPEVAPPEVVEPEALEPDEAESDEAEEMMPVEPDGGIGDGATPLPDAEPDAE